jgi:hypothetical protein
MLETFVPLPLSICTRVPLISDLEPVSRLTYFTS